MKVTKDHNELDKDEVNIISGVLEMRKKTVGDVMTPIEDAYMLPIDSIMDFETISNIMDSGYSRIPVFEGDRKNILSLLYIKDLVRFSLPQSHKLCKAFDVTNNDSNLNRLLLTLKKILRYVFYVNIIKILVTSYSMI